MNRDEVPAVRVEALWKRFGPRRALRGVDLTLAAGRCLAVFGANGAGKSTLLRVLATLFRPSSGRVEVFGCDVLRDRREVRRRVGVVFHDSGLRADLTLDENVRFFCGLYGAGAEPRRADALLERLRLRERRRDQVRTFSRGMLQRAALVRSLLHDPALWLLDEPFTGLDPEGQSALESLIGEEVRHGRTVVVVTHQVDVGLRLADDAVLIEEGAIALAGREAIRRHHAASAAAGPVGGAR